MKNLQVSLSIQEKQIGEARSINLNRPLGELLSIKLRNLKMFTRVGLKKGSELEFTIIYKNQIYANFGVVLESDYILESMDNLQIECSSETGFYNQNVIEIFETWDNGDELSWNNLKDDKKEAWLVACLFWSGLPTTLPNKKLITLDSSLIKSKVDCYCLLGEIFFGSRGYFGQDLDGLDDCMINISSLKTEKPCLQIKDLPNLIAVLDSSFKGYAFELIGVFKSHGFIVEYV